MKTDSKGNPKPVDTPFSALVRKVLSVPHEEIVKREAEYKRRSDANPKRRGPKRKA